MVRKRKFRYYVSDFLIDRESMETIKHDDGRVELNAEALAEIEASPLYNEDLAPVRIARRNWSTYNYAALWISMAHCIPSYLLASSLIASGMNWWEALITILLGNTIVLIPILLNSHPGTKYGIPFPVFARAVAATLLGCFFAWIGLIIPILRPLYDYAWFVGFGVAFLFYWNWRILVGILASYLLVWRVLYIESVLPLFLRWGSWLFFVGFAFVFSWTLTKLFPRKIKEETERGG
jgi:NCS1 family nucleobase:cation symporter-1